MKIASILLLSLVLIQQACPSDQPNKAPQHTPQRQSPTHRFVITRDIDLAFDTQTGQLCRTWDWSPVAPPAKANTEGATPQRVPGELTPTCLSLYEKYPTVALSSEPVAVESEQEK